MVRLLEDDFLHTLYVVMGVPLYALSPALVLGLLLQVDSTEFMRPRCPLVIEITLGLVLGSIQRGESP